MCPLRQGGQYRSRYLCFGMCVWAPNGLSAQVTSLTSDAKGSPAARRTRSATCSSLWDPHCVFSMEPLRWGQQERRKKQSSQMWENKNISCCLGILVDLEIPVLISLGGKHCRCFLCFALLLEGNECHQHGHITLRPGWSQQLPSVLREVVRCLIFECVEWRVALAVSGLCGACCVHNVTAFAISAGLSLFFRPQPDAWPV